MTLSDDVKWNCDVCDSAIARSVWKRNCEMHIAGKGVRGTSMRHHNSSSIGINLSCSPAVEKLLHRNHP